MGIDLNKPPRPRPSPRPRDFPRLPRIPFPRGSESHEMSDRLVPAESVWGGVGRAIERVNDWVMPGTDIYTNPADPFDPRSARSMSNFLRDCSLYPASPFCDPTRSFGGMPRIEPERSTNECETCVTITPVIGWRLPPLWICRRRENCPPLPPPPIPTPTPTPPIQRNISYSDDGFYSMGQYAQVQGSECYYNQPEGGMLLGRGREMRQWVGGGWGNIFDGGRTIEQARELFDDMIAFYSENVGTFIASRTGIEYPVGVMPENTSDNDDHNGFICYRADITGWVINITVPNLNSPPPPQPLPPMNNCCPETNRKLDKVKTDLDEIKKILGVKRFAAKAPRRLVQARKRGEVELKDYLDIFEYQTRQIDRAVGFLPMKVEVKDTSATQAGNQSMTIEVESIADGIKELLQATLDADKSSEATLNVALRTLYEAGITHKLVAEIHKEMDEIIEFLGFETDDATTDVKFAFNPIGDGMEALRQINENSKLEEILPTILKEKQLKVKYTENVDKKTLISYLLEIATSAEVSAQANSVRLKDPQSFNGFMRSAGFGLEVAQLLLLRQIKKALGNMPKRDFEEYLEEIEQRFTKTGDDEGSPVQGDRGEPFQVPRDNRPKIDATEVTDTPRLRRRRQRRSGGGAT